MDFLNQLEPYVVDLMGINVDPRSLTPLQVCARAVAIYFAGLVILRVGENRFLGRHTSFDIILAFLLGALLSRSVNGSAPFLPSLLAVAVLVGLHWTLGWTGSHWSAIANLLRGKSVALVEDGRMNEGVMHRHLISRSDLREALRLSGRPDEEPIAHAYLERNGSISIVPMDQADFDGEGTTRHRRGSGDRIGPEPKNPEQEGSRRNHSQRRKQEDRDREEDRTSEAGEAGGSEQRSDRDGAGDEPRRHDEDAQPSRRPRILQIDVEEGVQTVRLVLE